ncbi:hypothetical protein Hanom_Chr16g01460591 [Helianthus anomalus]
MIFGVHLIIGDRNLFHRNIHIVSIDRSGYKPGVPIHDTMNPRVRQERAVKVISCICCNRTDHVCRMDMLDGKQLEDNQLAHRHTTR